MIMSLHTELASGRWHTLSLADQLGNMGSEVSRALRAKQQMNELRMMSALDRALELCDLTIADPKHRSRLKELCRIREVVCDFFLGGNTYQSTDTSLNRYFMQFAMASRRKQSDYSA